MLPVVVQKNIEHATLKYARLANAMGIDTRNKTPEEAAALVPHKIEELIKDLHIPTKLSQLGVRNEDIPRLARDAAEDLCMMTNPQKYGVAEIEAMYRDAL